MKAVLNALAFVIADRANGETCYYGSLPRAAIDPE